MKSLVCFLVVLALILFVAFDFGDGLKNQVTVYPVSVTKEYRRIPLNRTVYKVFPETQLVIYWSPGFDQPPLKLAKCVVRDRLNWSCEYQDGSGKLTMVDGHFKETPFVGDTEYVSWWRWWLLYII